MAMLEEYSGDYNTFEGEDPLTALKSIRTFFEIVYSELMDESDHIIAASGFDTKTDEDGNVVVV